ncbi:Crp/Fnr family transcriptional regulator [Rubrobacter aplysinae]|uniref:Crp/Fnr family transcriptional regulator n=1 Tax=Rubrobacter aplysinae TaxID=909625 RepID=UPI00069E1A33|nr:Crp/Fnr family transcriptional regulator [Rubrobacter aplysinae]
MSDRGGYGGRSLEPNEENLKLLSLVDIFEPLSGEEIASLSWRHLDTRLAGGEVFYTPMDLCETLFILKEGRVRIYRVSPEGRQFTVAVLPGGTVFGEMALTSQRLRGSFAEAMEPSLISTMCRADVERLVLQRPRVGLQIINLLSDRLAEYEVRMEDISLKEVPERLASLILMLIESQGIRTSEGYKIPTRYTHQHLSSMIGSNREAVTRALRQLTEAGAVEVRRRLIHARDLDGLRSFAGSPED